MLGVFANYHNAALALDDLALLAHGLNGRSYLHNSNLHCELCALFTSPRDPTAGQVIRAHLNRDLVAGQDLNKVHPELAGNVCQNGMPIADIDAEHGIRQRINHDALEFDDVIFCQELFTPLVMTLRLAKTRQSPSQLAVEYFVAAMNLANDQ